MQRCFRAVFVAFVFFTTANIVVAAETSRDEARNLHATERQLREVAARGLPFAKRDLACFLYKTAGADPVRAAEAYKNMRTAAESGDSLAALYVSAYLRRGFGTVSSSALADAFLSALLDDIGRSEPPPLSSLSDAAAELKSGQCAPQDEEGAKELYKRRPAVTPLSPS